VQREAAQFSRAAQRGSQQQIPQMRPPLIECETVRPSKKRRQETSLVSRLARRLAKDWQGMRVVGSGGVPRDQSGDAIAAQKHAYAEAQKSAPGVPGRTYAGRAPELKEALLMQR
jgi:hypothetical protein